MSGGLPTNRHDFQGKPVVRLSQCRRKGAASLYSLGPGHVSSAVYPRPMGTYKLLSLWKISLCERLMTLGAEIGHSGRVFWGQWFFSKLGACHGDFHGTA
jgi:hypothetical protein